MKKLLILCGIIYLFIFTSKANTCSFDVNKACDYLTENALDKSHSCCAWFVMCALNTGGCSIGIAPAWYYKYLLPEYDFIVIDSSEYYPKKGDIVVIENSKEHFWGHIAMYNGEQWISDFKQKNMNPYRKKYPYIIFRHISQV